jgi:L-fucose isomerase-like protein
MHIVGPETRTANTYTAFLRNAWIRNVWVMLIEGETTEEWPHVFAKLPFDPTIFLDKFDANHCHAVYGDKVEELKMICGMLNIDVEMFS